MTALCQTARDEVRHDVWTGEWFETGITLLCSHAALPGLPFCADCLPRSDNRNAPYRVSWGCLEDNSEEFATFADAARRYAELRLADKGWGGPVITGANKCDEEDDGLSDEERDILGGLP